MVSGRSASLRLKPRQAGARQSKEFSPVLAFLFACTAAPLFASAEPTSGADCAVPKVSATIDESAESSTTRRNDSDVEKVLEKRFDFNISADTFAELTTDLENALSIKVTLDPETPHLLGNQVNPMRFILRGSRMKASRALDLLLRPDGFFWTIRDGSLLIKYDIGRASPFITQTYVVSDLAHLLPVPVQSNTHRLDPLVRLLQNCSGRGADGDWENRGGIGHIKGMTVGTTSTLLVRYSKRGHEDVAALLNCVRTQLSRKSNSSTLAEDINSTIVRHGDVREVKSTKNDLFEQTLNKRLDFNVKQQTLSEVVEELRTTLGIEIVLHETAFRVQGVNRGLRLGEVGKELVDLHASALTIRAALESLLAPLHGTLRVVDDFVLLTSQQEAANADRCCWVYDISDLLPSASQSPHEPASVVTQLREAIVVTTGSPENGDWEEVGGTGTIFAIRLGRTQLLIARQLPEVHDEIRAFLADLRTVHRSRSESGASAHVRAFKDPQSKRVHEAAHGPGDSLDRALARRLDFHLVDANLDTLIAMLEDQLGIRIRVDRVALGEPGIEITRTPLTLRATGISAFSALKWSLRKLDLEWFVRNRETVIVTARQAAANLFYTRVYDVTGITNWSNDQCPVPPNGVELLRDEIQANTGGDGSGEWESSGGSGIIRLLESTGFQALVIKQTPGVHLEIEALLAKRKESKQEN